MFRNIFLQQLKRSTKRTILYLILLSSVTAFFVMSVNLYQNSLFNLQKAEQSYSTLAVMELYGDVDRFGQLTEPNSKDHIGYKSVAVEGYDISDIINADGVESWDLRAKYAAYIENTPAMRDQNGTRSDSDLLRFRLAGEEPVTFPLVWEDEWGGVHYEQAIDFEVEVLDSAAGCFRYNGLFSCDGWGVFLRDRQAYQEQIKRLNRSEETDTVTLYPGVEYIVSTLSSGMWQRTEEQGILEVKPDEFGQKQAARFYPSSLMYGYQDLAVDYDGPEETMWVVSGPEADQPFPLQRWEDVQDAPKLKAYFEGAWDAVKIQAATFNVDLTDDITSVPVCHLGGMTLKEGRFITKQEYEQGTKVCMISDRLAEYQGWKLGDRLDLQFFQPEEIVNGNDEYSFNQPIFNEKVSGFFDRGSYEIVGIYTQNPLTGNSGIARSTLSMPWYTIFVPRQSVSNAAPMEELPVHGALFSLKLENGSIDRFLSEMEQLGLTQEKEGCYNPVFTFYDQGYSLVQPGLQAMYATAQLLLVLSSVLLIVTCVLMAFFFAQSQKQSVGIFRMLGGKKIQAIGAILTCALIISALSAALGAVSGHLLMQKVGGDMIRENLEQSQEDAAYQAYVIPQENNNQQVEVQADPVLTLFAGGAAMLFAVMQLGFVLQYIQKEPRELLPKGEG